ncbi:hypothetical protein V8C42DRAFT_328577 [Trichoderma barbatum]
MTTGRVEIIKRKQLSIQQKHEATAAILADRARGPEKFTLGHRGYTIINQGGFDGSFGNQSERRIL